MDDRANINNLGSYGTVNISYFSYRSSYSESEKKFTWNLELRSFRSHSGWRPYSPTKNKSVLEGKGGRRRVRHCAKSHLLLKQRYHFSWSCLRRGISPLEGLRQKDTGGFDPRCWVSYLPGSALVPALIRPQPQTPTIMDNQSKKWTHLTPRIHPTLLISVVVIEFSLASRQDDHLLRTNRLPPFSLFLFYFSLSLRKTFKAISCMRFETKTEWVPTSIDSDKRVRKDFIVTMCLTLLTRIFVVLYTISMYYSM